MTIKHLVISGGGPIGISFLGALEYLHEKQFWKNEDIESIIDFLSLCSFNLPSNSLY